MTKARSNQRGDEALEARLFNAAKRREVLFWARLHLAFISKAAGLRLKKPFLPEVMTQPDLKEALELAARRSKIDLQKGYRDILAEFVKMGGRSYRDTFELARDLLDETNFKRLVKTIGRFDAAKWEGARFVDASDMLILIAWDGFDSGQWPLSPVELSDDLTGYLRRDFPPLSRWTAHAARYCINWLSTGDWEKRESNIGRKAYEKRVRSMNLFQEFPCFVRAIEYDKNINLPRLVFSPEGERWRAKNSEAVKAPRIIFLPGGATALVDGLSGRPILIRSTPEFDQLLTAPTGTVQNK